MIELNIKPINWRNAYEMKVDYGVDHESYKVNQHNHLRRSSIHYHRDNSDAAVTTPAVSTPAVSTATTVAPSSQVVFPSPTSTPQPNQTVVEETIAKSFINAQILPISGSGGLNGFKVDGNSFPSDLALNCQNCTFTGNIQLTSGSFSTSNTSNSASHDSVGAAKEELSFIENGYIQVTADNLLAHVDLSTTWPLGFSEPLNVTLLDIPLTPFVIPGLATVGPEFKIQLLLAAKLSATANLTYGFEVTVPDNSTAIANIGQVNASSITGFGDTKFTALPFNANLNNIALNLSATLQLEVLVGISFLDGHDTAGAGVFVDLPTLALSVEPVKGTDQKCNPTTNQTIIQELGAEYDALFNIIPNVEINAGIIVQAKATIPGVSFAEQTAFTPLATTFPGPTACLAFPKSSGGLVSPTLPPANNAQATGGGSSSSGNHAHSQMVVNAAVMNAVIVGCLLFTGPLLMF
ncbi:MAG: hypothetical protein LQ340_002912 [Diploschistes diacapsis]|nr:MAG: hypothetical protein LQ340_002912 [Diploschistes diacapsis]